MTPKQIITRLGGASKTALLCDVTRQAVSQWKDSIPKNQLRYLKLVRPDAFVLDEKDEQKA